MPHYIVRIQAVVEAVNQEAAVDISRRLEEHLRPDDDVEEAKMTSVEITNWQGR